MSEHAHQLTSAEHDFLDAVCEGRPRSSPPEHPHLLIERHARTRPDSIAVRHREHRLSFDDLNRRANRLSHLLRAKGVGPESRVVVCVTPGFDIVVALLAILKAGASYVPLDPGYPAAHLRTILDDTRPALIIATTRLAPDVVRGIETLILAESKALLAMYPDVDPARAVEPGATAYVYYTSGTTGAPKGVMASYANLASYVAAARERYDLTSADVMPAIARFSFSISMFELLTSMSAGGGLTLLDRDHVMDPARLAEAMRHVTIFHVGPSLLRPLLDHVRARHDDFSIFDGVRHASSGGDLIPPEVLEWTKDVFRKAEVFVIYGCSEIACMGCTYEVPRDRRLTKTYVGRPFDGMAVRIVDDAGQRAPVGEVGEICFAGGGVVKGYLNRDELTATKFVELDGRRFYRTGDMGRITEEGFVEILGRVDFQAKIRGMRVELGEVEYHLRRAPNVKEGVVMPRDGADGEKVLVAYVVLADAGDATADGEPSSAAAIRRHMVEHLPDYMVPAIYLELPKLPLNHNFKVDRRALPAPSRIRLSSARGRPPETETEQALAAIWKRLLHVEDVCLDDNFFELGGHSLLAVALLVDVKHTFGVFVDGMDVLRESLEVLARLCDQRLGKPLATKKRRAAEAGKNHVELFHFGPGGSLYGVLTLPAEQGARDAVLICPPVGQEKARAHFVLQSLARRLAARGVATLQFDYYGTGDSLGDGIDATPSRWQADVEAAFAELSGRTGGARITAVGARFGATLLAAVAPKLDVVRLVFWDPITDGRAHVDEMAHMQREYLAGRERFSFRRRPRARGTELLGTTYSPRALAELRALSLPSLAAPVPEKWLTTTSSAAASFDAFPGRAPESRLERLEVDCAWTALNRLEDMLPDVGIAAALATLCTEES
ncbi:MAG TPA: amino acid adenylation domain-containing protein [Polyangiaceae bacterium]|jgi:amino acid adenylation domain-containing protein|nr:amino acid adenylation domain-containing protein [Polyangiaceae bacterium]